MTDETAPPTVEVNGPDLIAKIRQYGILKETAAILGEQDVGHKRWKKVEVKSLDLLYEMQDMLCEHDWRGFGTTKLRECRRCKSRRFGDAVDHKSTPREGGKDE